ncbi:MAG: enolase C-terminal domain-like protein [Thermoleophilaceae bacterium]
MRRSLASLAIPFREPYVTATGTVLTRELLLLRLEDDDGAVGLGEAAPFEPYDGTPLAPVAAALLDPGDGPVPPQARAAEEMALLDLEARREGRPLCEPGADAIAVNYTVAAGPPDEAVAKAKEGLRKGYSCFKLKVGLPDDADRVAAVRGALGPWPALRLDANGAWGVEEAVERIDALAEHDLQLVEQPCPTLEELALVRRRVSVPIAADEPIRGAGDVRAAAAAGACDAVSLKLATLGGVLPTRDAIRAAREEGLEPILTSTLDGPWGIAAALHVAAAERLTLACGLATLDLFAARLAKAVRRPMAGVLEVPPGSGLGVDVEDEDLAEVLVEQLQ